MRDQMEDNWAERFGCCRREDWLEKKLKDPHFKRGFEAGHRVMMAELAMEANRAALPKPPAYAREEVEQHSVGGQKLAALRIEGTLGHEGAGVSEVRVANELATPQSLFAQLREMGVRCETCARKYARKRPTGCTIADASTSSNSVFLCRRWEKA